MTLKMGWYDFMTSLTERPVWDTESHPLTDSSTIEYYPQEPAFVAADLWNGAVHGRGGTVIWCFDTSEASSLWAGGAGANWSNANMRHKPDVAVRVSETNLDMMRLSYELTALQKVKRKIGIVFSRTSLGYNTEHNAQAAAVYESCIFNGQKPLFISDTTYKDINKCEALVIPKSTTNVSVDMLNEIKAYMENGGKVILLDDIVNQKLKRKYAVQKEYDYRRNSIYKVYLACEDGCPEKLPALDKAVELALIDGYCVGSITPQQMRTWLNEAAEAMHRRESRLPDD